MGGIFAAFDQSHRARQGLQQQSGSARLISSCSGAGIERKAGALVGENLLSARNRFEGERRRGAARHRASRAAPAARHNQLKSAVKVTAEANRQWRVSA